MSFWPVLQHSLNPSETLPNRVKTKLWHTNAHTQAVHTDIFPTTEIQTHFWGSNLRHLHLVRVPVEPTTPIHHPRIYSHKVHMYVRTWWSRSGMSCGMSLHTTGIGHMCVTQSDMLDSDRWAEDSALWRWRWRSGTMVQQGNRGLDTANTAYPRPTANLTRATRTSLAPTYDACA